jgi:hypothetical protein
MTMSVAILILLQAAPERTREAVGAPGLAAHTVVHEKQAVGIVFLFHCAEPSVVRAPERLLPILLKVIGLREVGAAIGNDLAQFDHRRLDPGGVTPRYGKIGLVTGDTR